MTTGKKISAADVPTLGELRQMEEARWGHYRRDAAALKEDEGLQYKNLSRDEVNNAQQQVRALRRREMERAIERGMDYVGTVFELGSRRARAQRLRNVDNYTLWVWRGERPNDAGVTEIEEDAEVTG